MIWAGIQGNDGTENWTYKRAEVIVIAIVIVIIISVIAIAIFLLSTSEKRDILA